VSSGNPERGVSDPPEAHEIRRDEVGQNLWRRTEPTSPWQRNRAGSHSSRLSATADGYPHRHSGPKRLSASGLLSARNTPSRAIVRRRRGRERRTARVREFVQCIRPDAGIWPMKSRSRRRRKSPRGGSASSSKEHPSAGCVTHRRVPGGSAQVASRGLGGRGRKALVANDFEEP
jgi:hypothetical protein